jgi:hypothetical protein
MGNGFLPCVSYNTQEEEASNAQSINKAIVGGFTTSGG